MLSSLFEVPPLYAKHVKLDGKGQRGINIWAFTLAFGVGEIGSIVHSLGVP